MNFTQSDIEFVKNLDVYKYKKIQLIAKNVLDEIRNFIKSENTEKEIVEQCKLLLKKHGIAETWYYDCPALVLLGSRSCLSISGKDYEPSEEMVGNENLITIDLSPLKDGVWGDCSRSFVVEDGIVKAENDIKNFELLEGLKIERELHNHFIEFVKPGMSFEDVFIELNEKIKSFGFENLDFNGNLGHTIEKDRNNRIYFEKDNDKKLTENMLFTFEPHIRMIGKKYGFKFENIYYFENGSVREL